jgi:hypothetical protein
MIALSLIALLVFPSFLDRRLGCAAITVRTVKIVRSFNRLAASFSTPVGHALRTLLSQPTLCEALPPKLGLLQIFIRLELRLGNPSLQSIFKYALSAPALASFFGFRSFTLT